MPLLRRTILQAVAIVCPHLLHGPSSDRVPEVVVAGMNTIGIIRDVVVGVNIILGHLEKMGTPNSNLNESA